MNSPSGLRHRFSNSSRAHKKVSDTGYKLYLSTDAQLIIDKASSYERMKINQKIQSLAAMPRPQEAGKRIGATDAYRIAVGHYRLDYIVFSGEITVTQASFDTLNADNESSEKPGLYHVKRNKDGWGVGRRVTQLTTNHAAVNGMQNAKNRAVNLMPAHVEHAFGSQIREFTLFHNPTTGVLGDLWESAKDKLSATTPMAEHLAAVLDDSQKAKHKVNWVAHSQGAVAFVQAVNHHNKMKGTSLNHHKIQFHGGANNAWQTNKILSKAGIGKYGEDNNHPFDLVPNIIGLNTLNPIKIIGSTIAAPALSDSGPFKKLKSPHTLPNTRKNWKFWQWQD